MNKDLLKEVLYYEQLSPTLIILVLIVAFILGAIHALSPGHGKSLMAAYLIGTKGRIRDAITLALTLTISHVFTVLVVGFLALFLADFFLPETISKWFGLFSGIAIFFIGLWLFISRYRVLKRGNNKYFLNNFHEHSHEQHNVDKHVCLKGIQQYSNSESSDLKHEPHTHNHYNSDLSIWSNIAVGISGGVVPCPKAIVILLLAISLHKIALGIIIILVFSIGLAFTLVTLGIVVVKASYFLKRRLNDKRLQVISTFGAVVIIGLGIFLTYQSVKIILI